MTTLPSPNTPYYGGGQVPNPADVIQVTTAPSSQLTQYNLGTMAVDYVSGTIYGLVQKAGGSANWAALGGSGTSGIITLTGNTGGALTGSNINIVGISALAFAGSATTLTGTITPGIFLVSSLAGNSGGPLSPTSGLINIVGSSGISVSGTGSTLTISGAGVSGIQTLTGNDADPVTPVDGDIELVGAATSLNVTGSSGRLTFEFSDGAVFPGTVEVVEKLIIDTGANGSSGSVAMPGGGTGFIDIATTQATASSLVFVTPQELGTIEAAVTYWVSNKATNSFRINTSNPTDTSTVAWWLIN